jgi:hypothetical protein
MLHLNLINPYLLHNSHYIADVLKEGAMHVVANLWNESFAVEKASSTPIRSAAAGRRQSAFAIKKAVEGERRNTSSELKNKLNGLNDTKSRFLDQLVDLLLNLKGLKHDTFVLTVMIMPEEKVSPLSNSRLNSSLLKIFGEKEKGKPKDFAEDEKRESVSEGSSVPPNSSTNLPAKLESFISTNSSWDGKVIMMQVSDYSKDSLLQLSKVSDALVLLSPSTRPLENQRQWDEDFINSIVSIYKSQGKEGPCFVGAHINTGENPTAEKFLINSNSQYSNITKLEDKLAKRLPSCPFVLIINMPHFSYITDLEKGDNPGSLEVEMELILDEILTFSQKILSQYYTQNEVLKSYVSSGLRRHSSAARLFARQNTVKELSDKKSSVSSMASPRSSIIEGSRNNSIFSAGRLSDPSYFSPTSSPSSTLHKSLTRDPKRSSGRLEVALKKKGSIDPSTTIAKSALTEPVNKEEVDLVVEEEDDSMFFNPLFATNSANNRASMSVVDNRKSVARAVKEVEMK